MWNLSEVRQSRGSTSIHSSDEALETISIDQRVNWRSLPTWHRSSIVGLPFRFPRNSDEMPLNLCYTFERRMLEKLGSSHEANVEMRRVSVIQITFHWHASLRLLSFRLLSTRERKAHFSLSFLLLPLIPLHPFALRFSPPSLFPSGNVSLFRALDPQLFEVLEKFCDR